jgi:transcription-repair coupling factor (superfamily II helicase)
VINAFVTKSIPHSRSTLPTADGGTDDYHAASSRCRTLRRWAAAPRKKLLRRKKKSQPAVEEFQIVPVEPRAHPMKQQTSLNGINGGTSNTAATSSGREMRPDTNIILGSTKDDDDEDLEDDYDKEQRRRREKVQELLKEQDKEFLEERRKEVLGEFADAKSKEDIHRIEQSMKNKIDEENELKSKIARQQQGIELEILEPPDETGSVFEDNGNIKIQGASAKAGWYAEMDEELKNEWEALEDDSVSKASDYSDGSRGIPSTVTVNGKIVPRDALKGVRVGSAGGWTLEVFPGDFVVHRKYGIGRFEGTCLRPLTKLTPEQVAARDTRRRELVNQEIAKASGGLTPEEIRDLKAKFGTEEDHDPVSNPQGTVLEIKYADGIVHVPVDRAYRLSRYRAGDSVVKPRLSKVRGDQWRNARRKVEETTLELAQDVLALYATRETLARQPFDPALEGKVREFEETFQFEPTKDQQKCFEDVENDMVWRSRPMDRLVCGDVGFGKTEVALRAIYRAVVNGKQAAMLAPTGVLASQHFRNVVKRMGEDTRFNKRIALLRGGNAKASKAAKELRRQIKDGEVDIIVGTHALLSNDIDYKDLGLLGKYKIVRFCNCTQSCSLLFSHCCIPFSIFQFCSG